MKPASLHLRPASMADAALLREWRNDPETRANSFDDAEVSEEAHLSWLSKSLADPKRRLFIAEEHGVPVGTVRADQTPKGFELSWTVAPEARGRGLGKAMVGLAAKTLSGTVTARVKAANAASLKIAAAAGLRKIKEDGGVVTFSS